MASNLSRYKADLAMLRKTGERMGYDLRLRGSSTNKKPPTDLLELKEKLNGTFEAEYQRWYTVACAVLSQLLPDRLAEFRRLYQGDLKRKKIDVTSYSIHDWLVGLRMADSAYTRVAFDHLACVSARFGIQFAILAAAESRFDSSLFEIRQLLQAHLFDHELDAARELLTQGFVRAAGAIAGAVLESHLGEVGRSHKVTISKKRPTIGDLNDLLKQKDVIEVPTWRQIQRLADLRNLCDHDREREPATDEVEELIGGTDKISKTIF